MLHGLTDVYENRLGKKRVNTQCDALHKIGPTKEALKSIDRKVSSL